MSLIWLSILFISLLASFLKSPFLNDNSINSTTCNFTQWEPIPLSLLILGIVNGFPEQPCAFRGDFHLQAPGVDWHCEMGTVLIWGWDVLLFPILSPDSPVCHSRAASLCPLSHQFGCVKELSAWSASFSMPCERLEFLPFPCNFVSWTFGILPR